VLQKKKLRKETRTKITANSGWRCWNTHIHSVFSLSFIMSQASNASSNPEEANIGNEDELQLVNTS
jgi:hypothetical protein